MNYLQLTQRLRQECGVAGTGPSTVTSQVGEMKRLVDWVASAWTEIQGLHDTWEFLREDFSFGLVANVGEYTPSGAAGVGAALTDFRYWHKNTLRLYRTDVGVADEQWLVEWGYQTFRDTYRYNLQVTGRPLVFAKRPKDFALMFGLVPEQAYTCRGEYQRLPVVLSADADIPAIPTHLHMIVVYKAMISYGMEQAASEVVARAQDEYQKLLTVMEREMLPGMSLGNPMA